jgi:prolyl oligopeptidase
VRFHKYGFGGVLACWAKSSQPVTPPKTANRMPYPPAKRSGQIDDYHGTMIADPYRWLEDLDSPDTETWIAQENALTEEFVGSVPQRDAIRARLTELWDYERYSAPSRHGANYVYSKNTGLQNQAVLYVTPTVGKPGRVLLDPNTLSADGTIALTGLSFSDDGALMAYAVSASGSDWMTWRVRDVVAGTDRTDLVEWSKFSGASWLKDGSGFYYTRYAQPGGAAQFKDANYNHQVFFHRLGNPQAQDALVYERSDHPDWNFWTHVSEDGRWLIIAVTHGTDPKKRIFVQDLGAASAVVELLPKGDASYGFIGNDDTRFYFMTTLDAPNGRVISVELDDRTPVECIPQTADALEDVSIFGDHFIASYLRDAHSEVHVCTLDGTMIGSIALPGLGTAGGFSGKRDADETFYSFTSYTIPTTIYRYDLASGKSSVVFTPNVKFDPSDYTSDQIFYTSKDGTRVPMFISYKKGIERNGQTQTILYGYGGFDVSLTPAFSPAMLVWMEMGGVYAIANLRGGGEYGEEWHLAGTLDRKQNVFDDFIFAAKYLVDNKWTSVPKLAISGGSNGGLLVGAVMTQRPDLFGAALPAVGVMDMLRFQKFTIGWAWKSDYGSSDDAHEFKTILKYSPLHNLKPGVAYPPTLITTADHDDRVYPAHSFKFAAQLQADQAGDAPVLIRIESKAGHGAGKPTTKLIEEAADKYAFLVRVLGI